MMMEPSVICLKEVRKQAGQAIEYILQSMEITDLLFYGFEKEKYLVLPNNKIYSYGGLHTTLHTPNSRYIFREFECCMECMAVSESVSLRVLNDQIFVRPHTTLHTPNSRYIFRDF